MSDNTELSASFDKAERADRALTAFSGWAAMLAGILALHRWIFLGSIDWWARAGLILCVGLAVTWAWGQWPLIAGRLVAWRRTGGLNTSLIAVAMIAVLILANTMARRRLPWTWDLTKNQRFTLAQQSRDVLKSLKSPVKATLFVPGGGDPRPRELLEQYAQASDRFTFNVVDSVSKPQEVRAANPQLNDDLTGIQLRVEGKAPQGVIEFNEKSLTSAILRLTRDAPKKLLFTTGHGEPSVVAAGGDPRQSIQTLTSILKSQQWPVEPLDLYGKDAKVPDPALVAAVIIAGPLRDFTADELKRLGQYLDAGGRVLLLLNLSGPTYEKFLAPWGIKTRQDMVTDPRSGGLVVVTGAPDAHASVRVLRGQRALFTGARTVTSLTPAPAGVTVTELFKSGAGSEVVPNFTPGKMDFQQALRNATPGPASIAALAEKSIGTGDQAKKARVLVVGDCDFTYDSLVRLVPQAINAELAAGMVNYLAEEDALVAIPPKDENTEQVFLTEDQGRLLLLIHFLDFPLLGLILAVLVYVKRR